MKPRCALLVLLVVQMSGDWATARAQLSATSPFLPPDQPAAPVAVTENAPIEFRGVLVIGNRQQFNFFDPSKRSSVWVEMGDTQSPFLVRSYDAGSDNVTVEYGGRVMTLTLEKPKIAGASGGGSPMPLSAAMPGRPPEGSPPVVLNPTPADEARRLETIAAEVRRRRLMRQQAAQQGQQSSPPGTNGVNGRGGP